MLTTAQKHKLIKEFNQERSEKRKTQQDGEQQPTYQLDEGEEFKKLYKHLGTNNRNKDLRKQVKEKLEEKEENKLGPNMWITLNPQYRMDDDTYKSTFQENFKGEVEEPVDKIYFRRRDEHSQYAEFLFKSKVRDALNQIFKEVIVGRSWRNQEQLVTQLFKSNESEFIQASQSIMLKVMVIPSTQQKSADQIIGMFVQLYSIIAKQLKTDIDQKLNSLLHIHLDTAFKLCQHSQKSIKIRAYTWLAAIVESASDNFLKELKKRIIKSIFTHAIEMVESDQNFKVESIKLNALKIATRFQVPVKLKKRDDYYELITCHLIKIMMEDEKDRIRKEVISRIELNSKTLPYVIKKTLDVSQKVRIAVYKSLIAKKIKFDTLDHEDRLTLIINGLKDHENEVVEVCKEYLIQSICVMPGEQPEIVRSNEDQIAQKLPRVYKTQQLMPLVSILKALNLTITYQSSQITEAVHLLLRDVVLPLYEEKVVLDQVIKIVQLDLMNKFKLLDLKELYEELILVSFFLSFIKDENFKVGIHFPLLSNVKEILNHCISIELNNDKSEFENALPTIIIYQIFHILQRCLPFFSQIDKTQSIDLIKDFFKNSDWLHFKPFLSQEELPLDSVDELKEEDLSLSEFGIAIRYRDMLIFHGVHIMRLIFEPDNGAFIKVMHSLIGELKTKESNNESSKKLNELITKEQCLKQDQDKICSLISKKKQLGQQVDNDLLQQQEKLSEMLQKCQKKQSQITNKEEKATKHYLTLLKYYLKSIKVGSVKAEESEECQVYFEEHLNHKNEEIRCNTYECLGLLMIQNRALFDTKLQSLMDILQEQANLRKKTSLAFVVLKCIFDGILVHDFMLESNNLQDFLRQELRTLLMRQLRDVDFNFRLLATEGFCRLLLCEKVQNPWDFIARLILLNFEKGQNSNDPLKIQQQRKIKRTLEQFFTHFPRLSYSRCTEVFIATLFAIFYLLKAQHSKEIDPQWSGINLFYLFGTMSDQLKYKLNKFFAIFDQADSGVSFQHQFFKFFSYLLLNDNLKNEEKNVFAPFIANALQFVDFEELPHVIPNFEETFKNEINPIFGQLTLLFANTVDQAVIEQNWKLACQIYLKKQNLDQERPQFVTDQEVEKLMKESSQSKYDIKSDCDSHQILNHCLGFYSYMIKSSKEFQEQRHFIEENPQRLMITQDLQMNHRREAEKALRHLGRKTPSIKCIMKEQEKKITKRKVNEGNVGDKSKSKKRDKKQVDKKKEVQEIQQEQLKPKTRSQASDDNNVVVGQKRRHEEMEKQGEDVSIEIKSDYSEIVIPKSRVNDE